MARPIIRFVWPMEAEFWTRNHVDAREGPPVFLNVILACGVFAGSRWVRVTTLLESSQCGFWTVLALSDQGVGISDRLL